ncbi:hypothetical protein [Neomoorella thermoacetica]|nr:hypothetical protein [Moorella thermoacetica]
MAWNSAWITLHPLPALFTPEELDPERPGKNGGNAVAAAGKTAGENE